MKLKHTILTLLTIILSVLFVLMILEAGVRLFIPKTNWQFFLDATSDWQLDRILGWVQKPNIDSIDHTEFGWLVHFQTNEDGLTPVTAKRRKSPGLVRIIMFGDSTVVGRAVPQDKTVSAQLEYMLKTRGIYAEVINAGVQGYGTDQAMLRMEQLLPIYRPDVVIYGLCQNDFEENKLDEAHRQAKPIFKLLKNGKLEMSPPVLKHHIYSFFSGPRKWIKYSALYGLLRPGIIKLRYTLGNSQDSSAIGIEYDYYLNPKSLISIDWDLFKALLIRMDKLAKANGARFLFYAHPELYEVWDPFIHSIERQYKLLPGTYDRYAVEKHLRLIAKETGVPFLPVIDYFLMRQSQGPFHLLPRDPHCNLTGYRLIAEILTNYYSTILLYNIIL